MQCSNTAGRRGENSCRKGEKLLLEQEASSRDAENIVWHACYLGGRKSSISYKTAPPTRATVKKREKEVGVQLTLKSAEKTKSSVISGWIVDLRADAQFLRLPQHCA